MGQISAVFRKSDEREGAYRFVENTNFEAKHITEGAAEATWRRAANLEYVFVPIDGSSLSLSNLINAKGLGSIGSYRKKAKGLKVLNAIALSPDGVPLGLLEQLYWARKKNTKRNKNLYKRKYKTKETYKWEQVAKTVLARRKRAESSVRPWFQLDREGDFRQMLRWAVDHRDEAWMTIRSRHNRRLAGLEPRYLYPSLRESAPLGRYRLEIPRGHNRQARQAVIEVRACSFQIRLKDKWTKKLAEVTLWAVEAREIRAVPEAKTKLRWTLLTTRPVTNFADAAEVIFGYSQRWRVEEFHKTWKTTCGVEQTQLRTRERIMKWASILGSVAMRVERLKYLSREVPETPATEEFSRAEIDTVIMLQEPKGHRLGSTPTIQDMVVWVAQIGGYTGKSSGGPPGSVTIGRGLDRISLAVSIVEKQQSQVKVQT